MRLSDFEALTRRLAAEIPAEFLEGIAEVVVSPRTLPDPEREGIWTLGECIPIPGEEADSRHIQSRVVLYHGSFQALARGRPDFDWGDEVWETLTHEIRHHVEWRARVLDLEAFDGAVEANFSRQDGEPFDPGFYRDGLGLPDGTFQVDDDVFLERIVSAAPSTIRFHWHGESYEVNLPPGLTLPAFLVVTGAADPPPGELVVVLQKRSAWLGVFKRPVVFRAEVEARPSSR
jgi:predicted Zn-dependent protease with MMP-like domain